MCGLTSREAVLLEFPAFDSKQPALPRQPGSSWLADPIRGTYNDDLVKRS